MGNFFSKFKSQFHVLHRKYENSKEAVKVMDLPYMVLHKAAIKWKFVHWTFLRSYLI